MSRRALLAAVAAATLLVAAAPAEAAVKKGTYVGTMSDGAYVSLLVGKSSMLLKVARKGLAFTCTDGDTFKSSKSIASGRIDVSSRRFDVGDTNDSDAVDWDMTGTFSVKKHKVTGTYRETRRFNERNELDPNGDVRCQTGELTYSAKLRR